MDNNIELDNQLPMELVQKCADKYNENIVLTIDRDYKICIHIRNIDRIKGRKYLSNLEGRGLTVHDACVDFIFNLMNKKYCIRYKSKFYATEALRGIIKKSDFMKLYNKQ